MAYGLSMASKSTIGRYIECISIDHSGISQHNFGPINKYLHHYGSLYNNELITSNKTEENLEQKEKKDHVNLNIYRLNPKSIQSAVMMMNNCFLPRIVKSNELKQTNPQSQDCLKKNPKRHWKATKVIGFTILYSLLSIKKTNLDKVCM